VSQNGIADGQKKLGILAKDKFQGKFITEWEDSYKPVKAEFEEHDVSPGIAMAMSVKDDDEQVYPTSDETHLEIHSNCQQDESRHVDQIL
jgi:nucleosome binding factor SPN SPT16 subunit